MKAKGRLRTTFVFLVVVAVAALVWRIEPWTGTQEEPPGLVAARPAADTSELREPGLADVRAKSPDATQVHAFEAEPSRARDAGVADAALPPSPPGQPVVAWSGPPDAPPRVAHGWPEMELGQAMKDRPELAKLLHDAVRQIQQGQYDNPSCDLRRLLAISEDPWVRFALARCLDALGDTETTNDEDDPRPSSCAHWAVLPHDDVGMGDEVRLNRTLCRTPQFAAGVAWEMSRALRSADTKPEVASDVWYVLSGLAEGRLPELEPALARLQALPEPLGGQAARLRHDLEQYFYGFHPSASSLEQAQAATMRRVVLAVGNADIAAAQTLIAEVEKLGREPGPGYLELVVAFQGVADDDPCAMWAQFSLAPDRAWAATLAQQSVRRCADAAFDASEQWVGKPWALEIGTVLLEVDAARTFLLCDSLGSDVTWAPTLLAKAAEQAPETIADRWSMNRACARSGSPWLEGIVAALAKARPDEFQEEFDCLWDESWLGRLLIGLLRDARSSPSELLAERVLSLTAQREDRKWAKDAVIRSLRVLDQWLDEDPEDRHDQASREWEQNGGRNRVQAIPELALRNFQERPWLREMLVAALKMRNVGPRLNVFSHIESFKTRRWASEVAIAAAKLDYRNAFREIGRYGDRPWAIQVLQAGWTAAEARWESPREFLMQSQRMGAEWPDRFLEVWGSLPDATMSRPPSRGETDAGPPRSSPVATSHEVVP